jgi:hypothetical protein
MLMRSFLGGCVPALYGLSLCVTVCFVYACSMFNLLHRKVVELKAAGDKPKRLKFGDAA